MPRRHKDDHRTTWACQTCSCIFTIFAKPKRGKKSGNNVPFCPTCGDSADVVPHKKESEPRVQQIHYKPEELEVLERVLRGEIMPYQAAMILGRTQDSVCHKLSRMRKVKEKKNAEV